MTTTIKMVPVDALVPYKRNPRTHSERQVEKIVASIRRYGWTNPILVDGENGIIAGHGRLAAAKRLGITEVPVIELGHLSPAEKRAYIIADNRLALDAGWDNDLLASELDALLTNEGFDLSLTGFDDEEIAALLGEDVGEEEPSTPRIPDKTPSAIISRLGDIWNVGDHRLVCGDAGDPTVISRLMIGEQAHLCFTSPPYGDQREYVDGAPDWDAMMHRVFANLPMTQDGQVLVNLGLIHRKNEVIPYWDGWIEWMRTQGWRRFGWYVWDQGPGMPADWAGRFASSHEFIFHFNRESRKPNKIVPCKTAGEKSHRSGRGWRKKDGSFGEWGHAQQATQDFKIPDSVVRIGRHMGPIGDDIAHPAVFPLDLPVLIVNAYSDPHEIVFEPFNGSGTTILAAEQLGRRCRAIDIIPEYVDVAIKRFQYAYPKAMVTLDGTDKTFQQITAERTNG